MNKSTKACLLSGGIGNPAAAFMTRDRKLPGENFFFEALPVMGGSLGGARDPDRG